MWVVANGCVVHISACQGYLFDSNNAQLDQNICAARTVAGIEEAYDYPFELYWEIEDTELQSAFISTVSGLLGPGSVRTMIDHPSYVVARVGIGHVGIGNDFKHGSGIEGFADVSEARNVTAELVERGCSVEDTMKIWDGNFLRVFAPAPTAS